MPGNEITAEVDLGSGNRTGSNLVAARKSCRADTTNCTQLLIPKVVAEETRKLAVSVGNHRAKDLAYLAVLFSISQPYVHTLEGGQGKTKVRTIAR